MCHNFTYCPKRCYSYVISIFVLHIYCIVMMSAIFIYLYFLHHHCGFVVIECIHFLDISTELIIVHKQRYTTQPDIMNNIRQNTIPVHGWNLNTFYFLYQQEEQNAACWTDDEDCFVSVFFQVLLHTNCIMM